MEKKLLRLDVYFWTDHTDLAGALRALADHLTTPPSDKPSICTGVSHHSAIHNYGLGINLTGKLAIFEYDGGWTMIDGKDVLTV
jgi:hypothetical protein